jgi:hypothetical protein
MEEEVKPAKKLSKGEIVWTVIEGTIAALGLFFIVLGICADYVAPRRDALGQYHNWILDWQTGFQTWSKTTMSLRWVGVIILLIAVAIALISLNHYAKKSDVNDERALRRAQRMQVLSQSAQEPAAPQVVEATATEKPAEKPAEPAKQ